MYGVLPHVLSNPATPRGCPTVELNVKHSLPGDSVRPQWLRACPHGTGTAPTPASMPNSSSRSPGQSWPTSIRGDYRLEVPTTPPLGFDYLLEQVRELKETLRSTSLLKDIVKVSDEQSDTEGAGLEGPKQRSFCPCEAGWVTLLVWRHVH